jgi:hypothetical protein
MYNIYDVFENYKFNKLVNDDVNKIIEFTENYNIFEKTVIMEGYLDDLIDFEPVTEGVKDVFDKIIEFIKSVWRKIKEWIGKVIGLFRKKDKDYVKKSDAEVKAIGEKIDGGNEKSNKRDWRAEMKEIENKTKEVKKDTDDKIQEIRDKDKKSAEQIKAEFENRKLKKDVQNIVDKEKRKELESKKVPLIKFDNTYALLKHTEMEVSVPDMENPQDILDFTFKTFSDTVDYIKDQLIDENMKSIEDFNDGLSKIFGGKNLDEIKKSMLGAFKESDEDDMRSMHKEQVKDIADIIMEYLEGRDDFVKEFEDMSRFNDRYMAAFIKKIEQAKKDGGFDRTQAHNVSMIVHKGLGIVESIIRFGIRQVGVNYDRCKAIVDRVREIYKSSVNAAMEL